MTAPISATDATAGALTEDRLLGGRVRLLQPRDGYRAAVDPVLLAAACPARPGQSVLDMGIGTGAASLALAARVTDLQLIGLEWRPETAQLARRNMALNDIAAAIAVGDAKRPPLPPESVDHVLTNPPFASGGTLPPDPGRASAHVEGATDLADWLKGCLRCLRPRGWLTLIHRADRLDDVLAGLHRQCGAVTVIPLWPRAGEPARRVIVRARKGVRSPAVLQPGLVLHAADTKYTAAAEAVLRDAAPLFPDPPGAARS
ncbi:tRNA1(Val) (adenine(37)-N6)-methyltransferase [Caenispirillum bisanense]|uniref:tRNA1(Val) (adenine(37)-N6)-methyltransferase n=1 Tax=Caenispirillum bisanense TaxID=414052 RepID=UPI0031CF8EFA